MFNLIKAQQYRTLRDYTTYIIIIVGAAIYCFATMLTLSDSSSDSTGAGNFFLMALTVQHLTGSMPALPMEEEAPEDEDADVLERTSVHIEEKFSKWFPQL